jgi:DNA-binding MarR family transcriptional regulator
MPYNHGVPDDVLSRFRTAYWRAFREVDTLRVRQWERSRVTVPQLRVLYFLRRHPGATTGELARHLGITVSTTSGLVIKLVDRGLVVRGRGADDRRREPLEISPDGSGLLGEFSEDGRALLGTVAERLGDDLEPVTRALELLGDIMVPSPMDGSAGDVRPATEPAPPASTRATHGSRTTSSTRTEDSAQRLDAAVVPGERGDK